MNNPENYLTDYHKERNRIVMKEVLEMGKTPISLEEVRAQVQRIKQQSQSNEKKGLLQKENNE